MRAHYFMFFLFILFVAVHSEQSAVTVGQFLMFWGGGNISEALLLVGNNASLSWHGPKTLFPTLGGDWVGKERIAKFYSNFFLLFDDERYQLGDITLLFAKGGMVLVQYEERTVALSTQKLGFLTNTVIYTVVADLIVSIEVFLDTSFVYNQLHCAGSPYLYCGMNSPPFDHDHTRHRDSRPYRLPPSPFNNNITSNRLTAKRYFYQSVAGNFDAALALLDQNVTLTWQGSTFLFPSIGGTWKGREHINGFYNATFNIFNRSTFSSEILNIFASDNIVMLQSRDSHVAIVTGRPSVEITTTIFTFNDEALIEDIEVWLDTAGVLEATLCVNQQTTFSCKPYSTPPSEIALAFLHLLGRGNITGASSYLKESAFLSYHAPSALLGGVYLPRKQVIKFFHDFGDIFEHERFSNFEVVATEGRVVVVRFIENRTAVGTRLAYQLPSVVELDVFDEQIVYVHMFLDTATVLATKECLLDRTAIQCNGNKPIGVPRVSDPRVARPEPSEQSSNVTQNQLTMTLYLESLASGDIERSLTLLAENASLTWQGSLLYFPTLGGTWSGKERIRKFCANRADVFGSPSFAFDTVALSAASQDVVAVGYYENISATRTGRDFYDVGLAIFIFDDAALIVDVEFWTNTAGVLDAMLCPRSSMEIECSAPPTPFVEPPGRVWVTWIFGSLAGISILVAACTFVQYRRTRKVSTMEFNEIFLNATNSAVN